MLQVALKTSSLRVNTHRAALVKVQARLLLDREKLLLRLSAGESRQYPFSSDAVRRETMEQRPQTLFEVLEKISYRSFSLIQRSSP